MALSQQCVFAVDDPDKEPTFIERMISGKGSSIALAMLCSKAMVPIKLPVAVALTPYVHRRVRISHGLLHAALL